MSLHEKCPYSEFTQYLSVFSPNAEKYGPKKLRIWTLFTQCLNQQNSLKTFIGNSFALDISRPQTCNFIKKETLAKVFSCEFCKISENTFSYRTPSVAASVLLVENYMIYRFISWHLCFRKNYISSRFL